MNSKSLDDFYDSFASMSITIKLWAEMHSSSLEWELSTHELTPRNEEKSLEYLAFFWVLLGQELATEEPEIFSDAVRMLRAGKEAQERLLTLAQVTPERRSISNE